ncbi:MAG: 3-dehydroquinate synthase [Parasphingorhabdus sp.]|jgi:3-dehydroquinate synthase
MITLEVDLADRSYPIHIGRSLLEQPELVTSHIRGSKVMVVSNKTIAPLYLDRLLQGLAGFETHTCILEDGEQFKNLQVAETIFEALLEVPCDRRTTIIALGGGVVGDIAGFAAGCYQRGIPFIQIPTTLLSQVDSSVGGKTAVNSRLGKNMIGLFYQPQCVIADSAVLHTLPKRELASGVAEVIKTALIKDASFFHWLENNHQALLSLDPAAVSHTVANCCRIKAQVVAEDETEQGVRALLNLGHTFGHAIETGMGYGTWLHGEAVAAGMCMAARMSQRMGLMTENEVGRIVDLISACNLPVGPPAELGPDQFLDLMKVDKKADQGRIQLILLKQIGQAFMTGDYNMEYLIMECNGE